MENPTQLYNINKSLTDISGATTNEYGTVGINVYQIYPKQLIYYLSAFTSATGATFIGANNATAYTVSGFNIGKIQLKNFNIYNTASGNTNNISVNVDYVNSSGDRTVSTITVSNRALDQVLTNAININRITFNTNTSQYITPLPSDTIIVARDTTHNVWRNRVGGAICSDAVITVPNGYIGTLTDLYVYQSNGNLYLDYFNMYVKDSRNNIKDIRRIEGIPTPSNRFMYLGNWNYPLYPGDSVYFASENAPGNVADKAVKACVKLTAY